MIFSYFMFGAMAMGAVSIPWQDKINFIGWLAAASGFVSLVLWLFLRGKVRYSSRATLAPDTKSVEYYLCQSSFFLLLTAPVSLHSLG